MTWLRIVQSASFSYDSGARSFPKTRCCSLYRFLTRSGLSATWRSIQVIVAIEVCWPAMRRAIIICATSRSETVRPSL